jgi:hypothetical protein
MNGHLLNLAETFPNLTEFRVRSIKDGTIIFPESMKKLEIDVRSVLNEIDKCRIMLPNRMEELVCKFEWIKLFVKGNFTIHSIVKKIQ